MNGSITSPSRTAIVTGANTGLGYECARAILAGGGDWQVIVAARDPRRATEAVRRLRESTGRTTVEQMRLDLGSLASVRAFADAVAARDLPPLHALVCNAGIQIVSGATYTEDGIETTFAVNHLGHFLLVELLRERLESPASVVFVSSETHDPSKRTGMPKPRYRDAWSLAWPELDPEAGGGGEALAGRRRYTTSKLCNVLCAYELDRRLAAAGDAGVGVAAFNPGLMPGSGLARDYGAVRRLAWNFVLPALRVLPGVNSTRRSGGDLARLAAGDGGQASGRYFTGAKEERSSDDSYDESKASELWQTSAELIGAEDLRALREQKLRQARAAGGPS